MKDLGDRLGAEHPEVHLASGDQLGKTYEVVTAGILDADEVTDEGEFPEYGEFMPCRDQRGDTIYVEIPLDLEEKIVRGSPGNREKLEGLVFRVVSLSKSHEGNWQYELEFFDSFDEASESLSG